MDSQEVYVAAADDEVHLAEIIAEPLRSAGYAVIHNGTVEVGKSIVGEATRALKRNTPVVLCATSKAVGSAWTHQIVNAARVSGPPRVFVVQMDTDAYVDQLAVNTVVARYCDNEAKALADLLTALHSCFPPRHPRPDSSQTAGAARPGGQFLDEPSGLVEFDFEALKAFRDELRSEVLTVYPASLSPRQFLESAGLWMQGCLTRTGALLFSRHPSPGEASFAVKCVRYFGTSRSASRESVTLEGAARSQIRLAVEFVKQHTQYGERPSPNSAQAEDFYLFPLVAVREIVANAIVHRDYTRDDACVHVRLFSDRLEITSPGTWCGRELASNVPIDLEQLEGESIKRNFQLARLLAWTKYVEGEGSGIPTAVENCRALGVNSPTVIQKERFVVVRLHRLPEVGGETSVSVASRNLVTWPCQIGVIPQEADCFQYRTALDTLDDMAGNGRTAPWMLLSGMGGVGKTQIAAHYAHRTWNAGDVDLLMWVTANSRDTIQAAYTNAAGVVAGADPTDPDAAEILLAWLATTDKRWLIVLDDLYESDDLRNLWPPIHSNGRVLVTTRRRDAALTAAGRRRVDVGLFTADEAAAFLTEKLAYHHRHDDPAQIAALAADLGHLPLALAQASAYLADLDLNCAAYRARLADRRRTLADLSPDSLPDGQPAVVAAAWSLSIELADRLRPVGLAHPMLQLAAVLDPHGIPEAVLTSPPALAYLTRHRTSGNQPKQSDENYARPVDAAAARDALRAMHRLSLLEHTPTDPHQTVRVHPLIQRAVRESLPPDRQHALARAAGDALLAAWPEVERDINLAQALRANTNVVNNTVPDALRHPDGHPVLLSSRHQPRRGWPSRSRRRLLSTS
ncbi:MULTISPECIES: NB-ARC domain-containing protein [unclassified Frankia]|uniref:NB-ARC domain-containing protein n=1 Tax=unclassified Frankia TaxID=2632575 RepID=UPI002AD1F0F8|nr:MULTISPECIES: NB-ARC domain-containing protein [unclassified Frankia]